MTVLGVIIASIDADFYTFGFEVVEVFNSALDLVRRNPCEVGLDPQVSRPDSAQSLIYVLLLVLTEKVLVEHRVKLDLKVSHVDL